MPVRPDYVWRLIATGFSFALFGAGSIVLWVILFPLVHPFLGHGVIRKRRSRRIMHEVFRFYIAVIRRLGLLTYEISNGSALNRPGRIVISNHPSLLDIVFLISLIKNATCIVKPALLENPVMRAPIRAMGYLCAADPAVLVDRCAEELREGSTLIVFPEGTRTPAGQTGPFRRGAANIALQAGAPILPVYIRCFPPTLGKHEKWYQISPSRVCYRFHVGEDVDPVLIAGNGERSRAARRLTRYLQDYFVEQDRLHG